MIPARAEAGPATFLARARAIAAGAGGAVAVFPGAALVTALFAVDAYCRRWVDDDGFINLRIVRNFAEGAGPVYNVGERVEAGTSPLWIAILTLLRVVGFRAELAAVYGGIALAVTGLAFALWGAARSEPAARGALRGITLPLGALVLTSVAASWDYASSGLETGLAFAWLGVTFHLVVRAVTRRDATVRGPAMGAAFAAGLAPLVRPELALYAAVFLAVLVVHVGRTWRGERARMVARILGVALATPVAYQIFRMGYYGALVPNTALAKEAFRANWTQGLCYAGNFFGTYWIAFGLVPLGLLLLPKLAALFAAREHALLTLSIGIVGASLAHTAYVVAMGGDYMHARMLLPALFAALMPVAVVVLPVPTATRRVRALLPWGLAATVLVWSAVCHTRLRVGAENVCGVGDEHGWYVRLAAQPHPVRLEDFREHDFAKQGAVLGALVREGCAAASGPSGGADADTPNTACRRLFLDRNDDDAGYSDALVYPLADPIDPRVSAVVPARAIGMIGYAMPSAVHVVDRHALADPLASHFALGDRGRPGHEKVLPTPWLVARFTPAVAGEDAAVSAARRALECEPLRSVVLAATAPMTVARFAANFAHAFRNHRLRVPPDPFAAEAKLCGRPAAQTIVAGGAGGRSFELRCPEGSTLHGLRGAWNDDEGAMAQVEAVCDGGSAASRPAPPRPAAYGKATSHRFELTCDQGESVVGLRGRTDRFVRALAVDCGRRSAATLAPHTTAEVGASEGAPFTLTCAAGEPLGIAGRSGDLVDALGVVCPR